MMRSCCCLLTFGTQHHCAINHHGVPVDLPILTRSGGEVSLFPKKIDVVKATHEIICASDRRKSSLVFPRVLALLRLDREG